MTAGVSVDDAAAAAAARRSNGSQLNGSQLKGNDNEQLLVLAESCCSVCLLLSYDLIASLLFARKTGRPSMLSPTTYLAHLPRPPVLSFAMHIDLQLRDNVCRTLVQHTTVACRYSVAHKFV